MLQASKSKFAHQTLCSQRRVGFLEVRTIGNPKGIILKAIEGQKRDKGMKSEGHVLRFLEGAVECFW